MDPHVQDLTDNFLNKRVKHSKYSLRPCWDASSRNLQDWQLREVSGKKIAERGTVFEILEPDLSRGVVAGLHVKWDDGGTSKCLAYMVEIVA